MYDHFMIARPLFVKASCTSKTLEEYMQINVSMYTLHTLAYFYLADLI